MKTTVQTDRLQRDYKLVCDAREHGSHKAYADLMATYREPLYLLLLRMTRNTTSAADLTMETFGKAFNQLHRYAPTASFGSWLYTIGVNTYIDHLRRNRIETVSLSEAQHNSDGDFIEYQIPSGQPNPEEALVRMQRDEALKQMVDSLKAPYREIIRMRYYEDLSYEEIAKRLKLPLGTVKVRLLRAKNLLAAVMGQNKNEI